MKCKVVEADLSVPGKNTELHRRENMPALLLILH
jgi:hypothetical protein